MFGPINIKTEYSFNESLISIRDYFIFCQNNNIKDVFINDNNLIDLPTKIKLANEHNLNLHIGLTIFLKDIGEELSFFPLNNEGYFSLVNLHNLLRSENPKKITSTFKEVFSIILNNKKFLNFKNTNLLVVNNQKFFKTLLSKEYYEITNLYLGQNNVEGTNYDNNTIDFIKYNLLKKVEREHLESLINLQYLNPGNYTSLKDYVFPKVSNYFLNNFQKKIYNQELSFKLPKVENIDIKSLCMNNLKKYLNNNLDEVYIKRLHHELNVISEMNLEYYFLIYYDFVNYANSQNILVGPGRGSASGSLVCFLLNITKVDPIKYGLIFERFLNIERKQLPDIDLDVEHSKRDIILKYLQNKYSDSNVAKIIVVQKVGAKQFISDYFRINNLSPEDKKSINQIIKNEENFNYSQIINNQKLEEYVVEYRVMFFLLNLVINLPKNIGIHAAGILLSDKPFEDKVPYHQKDNFNIVNYTMGHLEEIGLLKLDILALKNLTILSQMLNKVLKINNSFSLEKIPLNSEQVFNEFSLGKTNYIFQFESPGMRETLKKVKPQSIQELAAVSALFRPGPIQFIEKYIERKYSNKNILYINDNIKNILSPTYGIIVFQEQIINLFQLVANFSLAKSDVIRRSISKKIDLKNSNLEKDFINGALNNGYNMDVIKKVWNIILNFTSYGFNKSHAISYSLISYYFVYFKLFYPAIYFETLFLDNSTHKDREAIFDEAKEKNILFKSSNFTDNNYNEFEIKDNILYIPLNLYINLDLEVYQKLVAIRKEQTQNINPYYFLLKVITTIDWNIDLFKKLTLSGYFNFLNMNPATVLKCLESYDISTFKSVYDIKTNTTLNGWVPDIVHQPANTKDILFDWKIWIYILEEAHNLFGFYIFGSPISLIIDFKKLNKNITKLNDILNGNTVRSQKVIFKIKSIKIIKDKSGSEMCFLTVMDDTEQMEGTIFAKDFSRFNDILFEEEYYISIVSSNEYKGKKTIIINDIQKIIF